MCCSGNGCAHCATTLKHHRSFMKLAHETTTFMNGKAMPKIIAGHHSAKSTVWKARAQDKSCSSAQACFLSRKGWGCQGQADRGRHTAKTFSSSSPSSSISPRSSRMLRSAIVRIMVSPSFSSSAPWRMRMPARSAADLLLRPAASPSESSSSESASWHRCEGLTSDRVLRPRLLPAWAG